MQIKLNSSPIHFAVLFIQGLLDAVNFRSTCYKELWVNKYKRLTCLRFRSINFPPARCARSQSSTSWFRSPQCEQHFDQNRDSRAGEHKRSMILCCVLYWYGRFFFSSFKWSSVFSYQWGRTCWRGERGARWRDQGELTAKIERSEKRWETFETVPAKVSLVYRPTRGQTNHKWWDAVCFPWRQLPC